MTKQEHTPGPWNVSEMFNVPVGPGDYPEKAPTVWIDRKADGSTGLQLGFCSAMKRERILADARLIAKAPDMLEALRLFTKARTSPELSKAVQMAENILREVEA